MERALAMHTAVLADPRSAWDARAASLRALAALADDADASPAAAACLMRALPSLSPHLASAVGELRSAVVRDACAAVAALSNTLGPDFAAVAADDLTPALLHASRVTIAVVAASASSAARALFTAGACGVPPRTASFLSSTVVAVGEKSHPAARAAAAEYLGLLIANGALDHLPDRVGLDIQAAVAAGCGDPAELVRDVSRANWRLLRAKEPRRAAAVLDLLPPSARALVDSTDFAAAAPNAVPAPPAGPRPGGAGGRRPPAGAPRRGPQRPSARSESDASSASPSRSARPPHKPPVIPGRRPRESVAEAVGVPPRAAVAKPNPFATRPARRSMATGLSGPLLRPADVAPALDSTTSSSDVSARLPAHAAQPAPPAAASVVVLPLNGDLNATAAPASLPPPAIPHSKSATEISSPDPRGEAQTLPAPRSRSSPAPRTASPSTPARCAASGGGDDEAEFSSAQGTPTPASSFARTPSPVRSGLGALLDETSTPHSLGSPLFPPTPDAVRQAARKARISFMCGPNVSPGPLTAPAPAVYAPPVAMMLPMREQRRQSMESGGGSSSPSVSHSSSSSVAAVKIAPPSQPPMEAIDAGSSARDEDGHDATCTAVAPVSLGAGRTEADQVAVSALLGMSLSPTAGSAREDADEDVQAYLEPLTGWPGISRATLGADDAIVVMTSAGAAESLAAAAAAAHDSATAPKPITPLSTPGGGISASVVSMPSSGAAAGARDENRDSDNMSGGPPHPPLASSATVKSRPSTLGGARGPRRSHLPPAGGGPHKPLLAPPTPRVETPVPADRDSEGGARRASGSAHSVRGRPGSSPQLQDRRTVWDREAKVATVPSAKRFADSLKRVEMSRSRGWEDRVSALTRLQESCQQMGGDVLDARLAVRAVAVLSEMTADKHNKVVPAALDALFDMLLGVESQVACDGNGGNPLQIALERRPEVLQRILLCLVDSRATTRAAAERVMHSLVAQFRPEVRAMLIIRALSSSFSGDPSQRGAISVGSPKMAVVGCAHLLAAFHSAEASGEGFVWQPVALLASLLQTMAALLRDRRDDVRGAAGPVVLAADLSLPPGAMRLALDALPLSKQNRAALQHILSTAVRDADKQDKLSATSETSAGDFSA